MVSSSERRVLRVNADDVRRASDALHFTWDADVVDDVSAAVNRVLDGYRQLEEWSATDGSEPVASRSFSRPRPGENPLGAWKVKASIRESEGALSGVRVVVKDSIAVAGLPFTGGSSLLADHFASRDAEVVRRVLAAGGEVVGTGVCEDLCFSGSSFTSADGVVRNPYNPDFVSGGSSSGSAVLVATNEADLGIGTDQGGSIRGPASWCGLVGLKPTFGLVPYTGALELERSVDHVGFLARDAETVDRALVATAGVDQDDPRTRSFDLDRALAEVTGWSGRRIGIIGNAFGWDVSNGETDELVRDGAERFSHLGMTVIGIDIDDFRAGVAIFSPILGEGTTSLVLASCAGATNWPGWLDRSTSDALSAAMRTRPNELPLTLKINVLAGVIALRAQGVHGYALAREGVKRLRAGIDRALGQVDFLLQPTMPYPAPRIPGDDLSLARYSEEALGMSRNNCVFNLTGHPAINIPCAMTSDGFPVGLTVVAPHGYDRVLTRLARDYAEFFHVSAVPSSWRDQ